MSSVDELVTFLNARYDEEERVAKAALRHGVKYHERSPGTVDDGVWHTEGHRVEGIAITIYDEGGHTEEQAEHIALHDPARVLREVESKRRLLDESTGADWLPSNPGDDQPEYAYGYARALNDVVKMLALPYSDRPGYREEWRP